VHNIIFMVANTNWQRPSLTYKSVRDLKLNYSLQQHFRCWRGHHDFSTISIVRNKSFLAWCVLVSNGKWHHLWQNLKRIYLLANISLLYYTYLHEFRYICSNWMINYWFLSQISYMRYKSKGKIYVYGSGVKICVWFQ
jgi:hypothetical protein